MKQIIKFLKKMSVENALFFFSMFGVAMMAFAFMGGNMRFLDEGLAIWLIIAGAVVAGVGMIGVFAKNDFFIYDINEASLILSGEVNNLSCASFYVRQRWWYMLKMKDISFYSSHFKFHHLSL